MVCWIFLKFGIGVLSQNVVKQAWISWKSAQWQSYFT